MSEDVESQVKEIKSAYRLAMEAGGWQRTSLLEDADAKMRSIVSAHKESANESTMLRELLLEKAREVARLQAEIAGLEERIKVSAMRPIPNHPLDDLLQSISTRRDDEAMVRVHRTFDPDHPWTIVEIGRPEPAPAPGPVKKAARKPVVEEEIDPMNDES